MKCTLISIVYVGEKKFKMHGFQLAHYKYDYICCQEIKSTLNIFYLLQMNVKKNVKLTTVTKIENH